MALRPLGAEIPFVTDRFMIAQNAPVFPDIERRKVVQLRLQAEVLEFAQRLVEDVEDSRELSLALTRLEEALMWADKAIFS